MVEPVVMVVPQVAVLVVVRDWRERPRVVAVVVLVASGHPAAVRAAKSRSPTHRGFTWNRSG
jgi:hypothetical protein